ncbi:MAG: DRTGG domain-containing protein [Candidatus Aminicenantales bacterium]
MKLKEIIKKLKLRILIRQDLLEAEVRGGYTSDLLSDVIANSKKRDLWITLQTHQNIIAVAKLKDLSGIIIVNNRKPDQETLKKAEEEKVPLFTTEKTAFEISGELYHLLSSEG